MAEPAEERLVRALTLGQASSIVVGIVIGSGIFVGANRIAQAVDSVWALFAVWIGAGLLTLLGALTYAEFGALFPRSGGDYVYAREALGPFWGFFNGWLTFSINYPASLAALGVAWGLQLDQLKPTSHAFLVSNGFGVRAAAISIVLLFLIINYFGVKLGGWTQLLVTGAKVLLIVGLIVLVFSLGHGRASNAAASASMPTATLATALVGALWAYDGWTGVTKVAGEVRDPQRNLPRALVTGMLGVIAVYLALIATYLFVLGLDGMRGDATSGLAIASRTAEAAFGGAGKTFVSLLILVSILGPINGLTLAGPRVYYAMARDRLFPSALARVHPLHRVPHVSLLFQGGITVLLILFFSFEQLTSYVVLASWAAYAITGIALLRLRQHRPDLPRPYRMPGYPVVPLLFVLLSSAFVVYLFVDALQDGARLWGLPRQFVYLAGNLFVMALAIPVYLRFVQALPKTRIPAPD